VGEEPENFRMMDTMMNMSAMIGAFVIYDYCTLFKEVRQAFHELPPNAQNIVNFLLKDFKGDDFTI